MRFGADGLLNILKESGIRSADTLNTLKKKLNIMKAGFTGVLDQFASGVLLFGINRGTKIIKYLHFLPKEYEAEIFLGADTDSLDVTGNPGSSPGWSGNRTGLEKVLDGFVGSYDQTPPEFSSKKVNGKRASDLVRGGGNVQLKPVPVTIHSLQILDYAEIDGRASPEWYKADKAVLFRIRVLCSTGTYIRSLARDIAARLGTVGFVKTLVRTAVGKFKIENSVKIRDTGPTMQIHELAESLDFLPFAEIKASSADKLKKGVLLSQDDFNCDNLEKGIFRVMFDGLLAAVLENKDGRLGYLDNFYTGS